MIRKEPGAVASLDSKCHGWPLFYRLRGGDLLLGGVALAGVLLLLFHRKTDPDPDHWRVLLFFSFFLVILVVNRAAYLVTGRGKIVSSRVNRTLTLLLETGSVDLREFALRNRIPFSLIRCELDKVMAQGFLLGYLDRPSLRIVLNDDPLASGKCPVCGYAFPEQESRICPDCGTVVYK